MKGGRKGQSYLPTLSKEYPARWGPSIRYGISWGGRKKGGYKEERSEKMGLMPKISANRGTPAKADRGETGDSV